uniref:Transposase Tc1-like domain-containing protein n=1 Tax=Magallana gigas TaxID=29159 RepID=A0A8W8NKK8_MAGGI
MWFTQNNELTACDSQRKLKDLFRLSVSLSCVRKVRRELGWSSNTGKYCQQISHKNKKARKERACNAIKNKANFRNVVFADETSVAMCSHGNLFFHQSRSGIEMNTRKRSRPKHGYRVNVWAGISFKGKKSNLHLYWHNEL